MDRVNGWSRTNKKLSKLLSPSNGKVTGSDWTAKRRFETNSVSTYQNLFKVSVYFVWQENSEPNIV